MAQGALFYFFWMMLFSKKSGIGWGIVFSVACAGHGGAQVRILEKFREGLPFFLVGMTSSGKEGISFPKASVFSFPISVPTSSSKGVLCAYWKWLGIRPEVANAVFFGKNGENFSLFRKVIPKSNQEKEEEGRGYEHRTRAFGIVRFCPIALGKVEKWANSVTKESNTSLCSPSLRIFSATRGYGQWKAYLVGKIVKMARKKKLGFLKDAQEEKRSSGLYGVGCVGIGYRSGMWYAGMEARVAPFALDRFTQLRDVSKQEREKAGNRACEISMVAGAFLEDNVQFYIHGGPIFGAHDKKEVKDARQNAFDRTTCRGFLVGGGIKVVQGSLVEFGTEYTLATFRGASYNGKCGLPHVCGGERYAVFTILARASCKLSAMR